MYHILDLHPLSPQWNLNEMFCSMCLNAFLQSMLGPAHKKPPPPRGVGPPCELGPLSPSHGPNMLSWPPEVGPQPKQAILAPDFPVFMSQGKMPPGLFTAGTCHLGPPLKLAPTQNTPSWPPRFPCIDVIGEAGSLSPFHGPDPSWHP